MFGKVLDSNRGRTQTTRILTTLEDPCVAVSNYALNAHHLVSFDYDQKEHRVERLASVADNESVAAALTETISSERTTGRVEIAAGSSASRCGIISGGIRYHKLDAEVGLHLRVGDDVTFQIANCAAGRRAVEISLRPLNATVTRTVSKDSMGVLQAVTGEGLL